MNAEVLCDGLYFAEGPRWHHGKLWFSDFYDHAVRTVDADGHVETKLEIEGQPSGLGWLPDGQLLVVSMIDRRLLRLEDDELVEHADLSTVAEFHCNDMVVDAAGRAYVGNFGFDLHKESRSPNFVAALKAYAGATLARVELDGSVVVAARGLRFPNGTVITPDGSTLIIAESLGSRLTAFNVHADGTLHDQRVWAELPGIAPDGICLDADGAVWVADALSPRCVRVGAGGAILAEVATGGQNCYACMLGGDDGHTLFMLVANDSHADEASAARTGRILITRVAVAHAGLP